MDSIPSCILIDVRLLQLPKASVSIDFTDDGIVTFNKLSHPLNKYSVMTWIEGGISMEDNRLQSLNESSPISVIYLGNVILISSVQL